jgi:hypothetical protein
MLNRGEAPLLHMILKEEWRTRRGIRHSSLMLPLGLLEEEADSGLHREGLADSVGGDVVPLRVANLQEVLSLTPGLP